jgi:hypothetical protein
LHQILGIPEAVMGETEHAADWLDKMIDQRDNAAAVLPRIPFGAPLRSTPRWPSLAKRMNLPG